MNYLTQVVCVMTSGIIYKFKSEEGDKHGYCTQFWNEDDAIFSLLQRVGCDHLMSVQNAQESTEEKLVLVK